MADHPIWRGQLRLALVSCPVALYSVKQPSETLHFHFINPDTGHRVHQVTVDAETNEEVSRKDLKRGYEFERDRYVVLEDEDFEHARIDSSSVLAIDKFVRADSIDPIYYDASYYLVPDTSGRDAAEDVYVVLREAIERTGRLALSRLVIARRERAVAIMPMERGMVVHTLHDTREITSPEQLFADIPDTRPDKEMVTLATQLIDRQTERFSPSDMEDRYEARLREVIRAKLDGVAPEPDPEPEDRGNVIDLMSALRRSLGESPAGNDDRATARTKEAPASAGSNKRTSGGKATTAAKAGAASGAAGRKPAAKAASGKAAKTGAKAAPKAAPTARTKNGRTAAKDTGTRGTTAARRRA